MPKTPPLTKFVDPLPTPPTAIADPSVHPGADYHEITMRQGSWRFHRDLGPSTVWGYWAAHPQDPGKAIGMGHLGPTISVNKDHPTVVKYRNDLPTTHLFPFVIDGIRNGNPQLTPVPPPPYKPHLPPLECERVERRTPARRIHGAAARRHAPAFVRPGRNPIGTDVTLTNYNAPVHFPGGGPEIPEIMRFKVTGPPSGGRDKTTPPEELRLPAVATVRPEPHTRRREWVLYQHKLFRTMTFNAVPFMEPSEDFIKAGSTEIWEYVNPHHDAHPMHVHLVDFQVLNRQAIDAAGYREQYEKWIDGGRKAEDRPVLANYLTGPPISPDPDEGDSNKDTVKSYPETVTRIIIREFTPPTDTIASIPGSGTEFPAQYVHHCHVLEHEDDDLMRPWTIVRD
ncbi:multicopper oxidase domain-containing protein [Streptomyces flavotricini]|uniref:multicopper oxidase domain-containing protein n=1 Tax=Streptomyces flavotricini TaxID=66888 RepID=UPI001E4CBBC2|nr:multicopper oxidase domain-containing protein [Streptomyces flavotricini]